MSPGTDILYIRGVLSTSQAGSRTPTFPRDGSAAEAMELEEDPLTALGLDSEDVEEFVHQFF